jgi:hypothetical protein
VPLVLPHPQPLSTPKKLALYGVERGAKSASLPHPVLFPAESTGNKTTLSIFNGEGYWFSREYKSPLYIKDGEGKGVR